MSADGTIDWYLADGLQSRPALWRLLDPAGGAVRVGPERSGSAAARTLPPSEQSYRSGSNVVETVLEGSGGRRLSVVDFLEWPGPGLGSPPRIIRLVRALSGPIDVEVEVIPSARWGPARQIESTSDGLIFDGIVVRTGAPMDPSPVDRRTARWRSVRRLDEGESFVVAIGPVSQDDPLTVGAANMLLESTLVAWRSWIGSLVYDGPYRREVERAVLAVRSLAQDGATAGSGTLSLPRRIGSERNSDDRWVRWRDVAASALTYSRAGFTEDAQAAETWLRNAVSESHLPWPVWLDPDGKSPPPIETLGISGWRKAEPVVVGVPEGLLDIDCYGDVVSAIGASAKGPGANRDDPGPLTAAWAQLAEAADWMCDHWAEPDAGVWASVGPPAALVASRVQAWYALDRMTQLAWAANPLDLAAVPWRRQAQQIAGWLDTDGLSFDGGLRRDGHAAGDDEPDAALLRIAWRSPWPESHPIVTRTVDRILDRLSSSGLVYRHSDRVDDGLAGPDNPDLLASLWAVRALAILGRWEQAHERMEVVSKLAGPAGLLSDAADPLSGELMGNLPSTATHLALVDAAFALSGGPA